MLDRSNDPRRRSPSRRPSSRSRSARVWRADGTGRARPHPSPRPQPAEIAIASIAPADGSTPARRRSPRAEPQGLCTDDLRVTFSVLPERDLAQARISVTFYEARPPRPPVRPGGSARPSILSRADGLDGGVARGHDLGGDAGRADSGLRAAGDHPSHARDAGAGSNQRSHSEDFGLRLYVRATLSARDPIRHFKDRRREQGRRGERRAAAMSNPNRGHHGRCRGAARRSKEKYG